MRQKPRIVLTGGAGFIGGALIPLLKKEGLQTIDLGSDVLLADKREDALKKVKMGDVVVHLACSSIPATSEQDRAKDIEENLIGTIALLETCVQKKVSKFVYLSTGGALYEDKEGHAYKETDAIAPKNSYGALKASIEHYIGVYSRLYSLECVIIRPGNIYGRSSIKNDVFGAVDVFLHKALSHEEITILGDGNIVRDYIHINDAANFILKAATKKIPQGAYNLGTGTGVSLNEIVAIIEKLLGRKVAVKRTEARKSDVSWSVLDITKARSTGWKPSYPELEKGMGAAYGSLFAKKKRGARRISAPDFE